MKNATFIACIGYYSSCIVLLLIVCILPVGMSRSAWLAAGISSVFVLWKDLSWGRSVRMAWFSHKWKFIAFSVMGVFIAALVLVAFFQVKIDSANGRLFMWKISLRAISEKPLIGYGYGSFPTAYGNTQEAYFATGDYTSQEEFVAGSPEYAFNEYFRIAFVM